MHWTLDIKLIYERLITFKENIMAKSDADGRRGGGKGLYLFIDFHLL